VSLTPRPSRRPRRIGAAVVCAALVLAGCGGHGSSTPQPPTIAEVTALLARHATAMTEHSSAKFLGDVDRSNAASDFRGRQSAQLSALAAVPLQSWSYQVEAPVTDGAATAAAAKRFGAPATIVQLSLRYQLSGVDPQPSAHDLWWTFVRRGGSVYAAADDDLARTGGTSWRGPWDFGPLQVHRGVASLVLSHPDAGVDAAALAATADAAVRAVSSVVGTGWARRVAVLVSSSATELDALGGDSSLRDISAITVFDPAPGSDGAPTGARVLVDPAAVARLTPAGRSTVLRHEITHIAVAAATTINQPRWLIEGLAEYVANLGDARPPTTIAAELHREVAGGTVPAALPTDGQFSAGSPRAAQVYEESWLACRLIAEHVGTTGLLRLYRTVGATAAAGDGPVSAGFRDVLHESLAQFVTQWRAYLIKLLR
jgi:hypothetical protein